MATHIPGERDYVRDSSHPSGPPSSGLGAAALGFLGGLAVFEIATRVARPWMRVANVGIAKTLQRYTHGTLASLARRSAISGIAPMEASIGKGFVARRVMPDILRTKGVPSVSGMMRHAVADTRLGQAFKVNPHVRASASAYQRYRQAVNRSMRPAMGPVARSRQHLRNMKAFITGRHTRIGVGGRDKSASLPGSFRNRLAGRLGYDLTKNYLPTLPAAYLGEKLVGIMPGHQTEFSKMPNWWNPLSVAADFGKFAGGFYPVHLAFGGVTNLAKGGYHLGRTGIMDMFGPSGSARSGVEQMVKALAHSKKALIDHPKARRVGSGIQTAARWSKSRYTGFKQAWLAPGRRLFSNAFWSSVRENANVAHSEAMNPVAPGRHSFPTRRGSDYDSWSRTIAGTDLDKLLNAVRGTARLDFTNADPGARDRLRMAAIGKHIGEHQKKYRHRRRKSFWQEVMGTDFARTNVNDSKFILQRLGWGSDSMLGRHFKEQLSNLYIDIGVLQGKGGRVTDIRKVHWQHLLKKTSDALNKWEGFNFGPISINPYHAFKMNMAVEQMTHKYNHFTWGVGERIHTGGLTKPLDGIVGKTDIFVPGHSNRSAGAIMAGGKLFKIDYKTGGLERINAGVEYNIAYGSYANEVYKMSQARYAQYAERQRRVIHDSAQGGQGFFGNIKRWWERLDRPFSHPTAETAEALYLIPGMHSKMNANALYGYRGRIFDFEAVQKFKEGRLDLRHESQDLHSYMFDLMAAMDHMKFGTTRVFNELLEHDPDAIADVLRADKTFGSLADLMNDRHGMTEFFRKLKVETQQLPGADNKIRAIFNKLDAEGVDALGHYGGRYAGMKMTNEQLLVKWAFEQSAVRSGGLAANKNFMTRFSQNVMNRTRKLDMNDIDAYDVFMSLKNVADGKGVPSRYSYSALGKLEVDMRSEEFRSPILDAYDILKRQDAQTTLNAFAAKHNYFDIPGFRKVSAYFDDIKATHSVTSSNRYWIDLARRKTIGHWAFADTGVVPYVARIARTEQAMNMKDAVGGRPITAGSMFMRSMVERFNRTFDFMGLGVEPGRYGTAESMAWALAKKRFILGGAMMGSYQLVDHMTALNPMFDNTMFSEGITPAIAEGVMRHRMAVGHVFDALGITTFAQHMEGLAPGAPPLGSSSLASLVRGLGLPVAGSMIGATMGAPAVGLALGTVASAGVGFGTYDLTKDTERLRREFSGEELVPIRKGRWWELGRSYFRGGKIEYFRPSWYAKVKSGWQYTDTLWGSRKEAMLYEPWPLVGINPIGLGAQLLDPYHYERKHYFSRPYPETGDYSVLPALPVVGNLATSFVTNIIKPKKLMHQEELRQLQALGDEYYPGGYAGSNIQGLPGGVTVGDNYSTTMGEVTRRHEMGKLRRASSQSGAKWNIGEMIYRFEEGIGLHGFGLQTITDKFTGSQQPWGSQAYLENAGKITDNRRLWWDQNLGGLGGTTEGFRRLVPRERQEARMVNPLRNTMPLWLPGGPTSSYFINFRTGDPYAKIKEGEIRLPGKAYESLYNVKLTYPARSAWLGMGPRTIADIMTGAVRNPEEYDLTVEADYNRRAIQRMLAESNMLVKSNVKMFDPYDRISGTLDAIIRKNRQNSVLEVKSLSTEDLQRLSDPLPSHVSEINSYMKMTNIHKGVIMYVSSEDSTITKEFDVFYNSHLYEEDLKEMLVARRLASKKRNEGGSDNFEAYSMLDRLRILADVAPYSDEYKETAKRIRLMERAGLLDQDQKNEVKGIKQRRQSVARKYDLYPMRFLGTRLFAPDEQYQLLSENQHIKAAAEYTFPERVLGAAWEAFAYMESPLHGKLLGMKTPRQHYQSTRVYGRETAFWDEPMRDFVDPMVSQLRASTNPMEGAWRGWLAGGFLFGYGSPMAAAATAVSSAWGATHGMYRDLTDSTWIPANVQARRDMNEYFDHLKYVKARRLYQQTGEARYGQQMAETFVGLGGSGWRSNVNAFRALGADEKPYFWAFLEEGDPEEQQRILQMVSPQMGHILAQEWGVAATQLGKDAPVAARMRDYFKTHNLPDDRWPGWSPNIALDDIQVKTVQKEGLDAHDFGLGWYEQEYKLRTNQNIPGALDVYDSSSNPVFEEAPVSQNELVGIVTRGLRNMGISVTNANIRFTNGDGTGNIDLVVEVQEAAITSADVARSQSFRTR